MSTLAHPAPLDPKAGVGLVGAVALHVAAIGLIAGWSLLHLSKRKDWGEHASSAGAVQASMVSAIPLPPKADPVPNSVLAEPDVSKAPEPPPPVKTEPPPKPTDIPVKEHESKVPVKPGPKPTIDPPKHPQPTPDTSKANTGTAATQLPMATSQAVNGVATVTVQSRTFGNKYAYYLRVIGATVTRNYNEQHPDARASQDKSVTILFDVNQDGTVGNLHMETPSGSPTLDAAAKRSVLLVDNFGPLPEGDHITIEYKFDYHHN